MTDDALAPLPLRTSTLSTLDHAIVVPTYDRSAVRASVVHIGVGGFHRAHLATYVDELCAAGDSDWGIVGCGVLPGDAAMADALRAQDNLYTLITKDKGHTAVRVIGSLIRYIHAYPDTDTAIEQIANVDTKIVSLTVTEGGYPVDDLTGEYLTDSPNTGPQSAFGIIAAALERRFRTSRAELTIMSCDNIMSNGTVARTATLGEASQFGPKLLDWIATSVSFPNSMVDRITPATTERDRDWLADNFGLVDRWPVVTEPFRQWVVEDDFAGGRPAFEDLDIIITNNVEPYELMKLRLLNASHSCLAYLAALDGIETVHDAMSQPSISRYVRSFLDHEAAPVLPPVTHIDIDTYNDTLLERFANPAIGDQISRLCLDGSVKFPKFLMPTVRAQVAAGGPVELSALALAGWCQYLLGATDNSEPIALSPDPQLDEAVAFAHLSLDAPRAFLGFEPVFGQDLAETGVFAHAFEQAVQRIRHGGIRSAIDQALP